MDSYTLEIDIPKNILDRLRNIYKEKQTTRSGGADLKSFTDISFLDDFVNTEDFIVGNFFTHDFSYMPHVDQFKPGIKTNLLIPLFSEVDDQQFVIFDQTYVMPDDESGCSWCWHYLDERAPTEEELFNIFYHKTYRQRPCETPGVQSLTDKPVSKELHSALPYDLDFYYGLSGKTWHWSPGKGLLFDSDHIHCSGKLNTAKVGVALWFGTDKYRVIKDSYHV